MNKNNISSIETILSQFDFLRQQTIYVLTKEEIHEDREIYKLLLDLLYKLNKLESEYEEVGKLQWLKKLNQLGENIEKEVEETEVPY